MVKLCPFEKCKFKCDYRAALENHIADKHGGNRFREVGNCDDWKAMEKFVEDLNMDLRFKVTRNSDLKSKNYFCARSGPVGPSTATGMRNLKKWGSKKINVFCPFYIQASEKRDGSVGFEMYNLHKGHDPLNVGHQKVPKDIVREMDRKVMEHVPNKYIRRAANAELSQRGLGGVVVTSATVNSRKVQLFPGYGVRETVDGLKKKLGSKAVVKTMDVSKGLRRACIIVTTPELMEALSRFGHTTIMMDSTHGTNHYDLKLNSILVRKPNQEFLAVAFCISPTEDAPTIANFLSEVLPSGFKTAVFMSDMAQAYYNAWKMVGGQEDARRVCLWHVKKAWKRQAGYKAKKDVADNALKELFRIAEIAEEGKFNEELSAMMTQWGKDSRYNDFSQYFKKIYLEQFPPELWARCHVRDGGPRFNMAIENFHGQFKYGEMDGRPVVRLDVLVDGLESYLEEAGFRYAREILKRPWKAKDGDVETRHERAGQVTGMTGSQDGVLWIVDSSTVGRQYRVSWQGPCQFIGCLKCHICLICHHTLKCDCPDYRLGHICKHAHAVVCFFPTIKDRLPVDSDGDRQREADWGHNLRPSKSRGFLPEYILETMSDEDAPQLAEEMRSLQPADPTEEMPLPNEDTLHVPEMPDLPEFITESISDEETEPTEEICPPEYDSDDPNRLLQALQKLPRNKRVQMINSFEAQLNRVPVPPANKKAVKQTLYPQKK